MKHIAAVLETIYGSKIANQLIGSFTEMIYAIGIRRAIDGNVKMMDARSTLFVTYTDQLRDTKERPLKKLDNFVINYATHFFSHIHILPYYPSTSDWGFSVKDYKQVNSDFGDWEDIEALGAKVDTVFDFVLNHTSVQHEWFQKFLAGDPEYKDFYIEVNPATDLSAVVRPRSTPLLTRFESASGPKWIWTTFSADQVDLNYANPKVLEKMIDVMLFYVSKGAKILRMDAIAYLWKEIGTTCIHHPKTHEIIRLLRAVLDEVAPDVMLLSETNVPHKENISYFGTPDAPEAQMVYQFPLPPLIAYSILKGEAATITRWAATLDKPWGKNTYLNFTASHDGVGIRPLDGLVAPEDIEFMVTKCRKHGGNVSFKQNSDGSESPYELNCNYLDLLAEPDDTQDMAIDKFILSQAIMLAMPGMPAIYFHSLVGSRNYYKGVEKTGEYRAINREKLEYDQLVAELDKKGSFRNKVYTRLIHLIDVRKKQKAFSPYADFSFPEINKHIFAIYRQAENGQRILGLHNVSREQVEVSLSAYTKKACDILTALPYDLSKPVELQPWGVLWLELT
ncbi:MAG TPA: sugar phosphorylase [bacterium]|nr:sugar phosphorylase [bacterium]